MLFDGRRVSPVVRDWRRGDHRRFDGMTARATKGHGGAAGPARLLAFADAAGQPSPAPSC